MDKKIWREHRSKMLVQFSHLNRRARLRNQKLNAENFRLFDLYLNERHENMMRFVEED